MSFLRWLPLIREWRRRIFFWHGRSGGSREFIPDRHDDHALVLTVTKPSHVPRWQQLRFLHRLLSPKERKIFFLCAIVFLISASIGLVSVLRPRFVLVPTVGGSMTEALVGTPKFINPLYAPQNDVDRDLVALIYSGLFRTDDQLIPQPDLAERYRWIEDRRALEMTLRKDARFHDGEPVTSDDVVFTYQAAQNPAWRSPLLRLYRGITVTRIDDYTVQFRSDKSNPSLLYDLTLGILPAHLWEDVAETNAPLADLNIRPVGSGPYRVSSFTRDSKGAILTYTLKRVSNHYGVKPFLQERAFRFYPDRKQAIAAMRGNQVDALAFVSWSEVDEVKNERIHAFSISLPQETVAFFNTNAEILKDERVRQALGLAIDKQELSNLIGSHVEPVSSPFPFLMTSTTPASDLDAARSLLLEAGWELAEGASMRTKRPVPAKKSPRTKKTTASADQAAVAASSTPLILIIDAPNQSDLQKTADYLKRRWSLLGAHVEIRTNDTGTLKRGMTKDRAYDVLIWNVLLPPTQNLRTFWESAQATEGGRNFSNLKDRHVDTWLDAVEEATSTDMLREARQRLSDAIVARTPALFLLRSSYAYLVASNVRGAHDLLMALPADRLLQGATWYEKTGWRWK